MNVFDFFFYGIEQTYKNGFPFDFMVVVKNDDSVSGVPKAVSASFGETMNFHLRNDIVYDLVCNYDDRSFTVKLTFGGNPAYITIPFNSVLFAIDNKTRASLAFGMIGELQKQDQVVKQQEQQKHKPKSNPFTVIEGGKS